MEPQRVPAPCATIYQEQLREKANDSIVGTHLLSCNGVDVPFPAYSATDVPLLFDHGKSVADGQGSDSDSLDNSCNAISVTGLALTP